MTLIGTTATAHILKPQIGQIPSGVDLSNSVEHEYLCLKLCAALGLKVAKAEIVDFAGKGSDTPAVDQAAYLNAQIICWLIGATDGHAKNISIFLAPGQRFLMTPL